MWSLENDVILAAATHYMNKNKPRMPFDSKSFGEPPLFYMPETDSYFKNCGEIIITANYLLVFRCSLCGNKYGSLFNFLQHLALKHERVKKNTKMRTSVPEAFGKKQPTETKLESIHEHVLLEINNEVKNVIEPSCNRKLEKKSIGREDAETEKYISMENVSDNGSNGEESENTFDLIIDDVPSMEELKPAKIKKATCKKIIRKCDKCDKVFSKKHSLNMHALSHSNDRRYKCPLCETTVKYKQNLQKHMLRHTNEKKFKCNSCEKQFFTSTEVKIHERTHTGERPYCCYKCGDSFKSCGNLSAHLRRHENLRTKKCEICGKYFFDMPQLKEHMAGHSSERPYPCKYCSSRFSRRKTLLQHMKLHINAREYACSLCDKSFNQRPALLSHMNNNHKALEYTNVPKRVI